MNIILKIFVIYLASPIYTKTQESQFLSNDSSIIWTKHYKEKENWQIIYVKAIP